MNLLATEKRSQVIAALVEGTSINATCRMTGVAKHTVLKLLKNLGCACAAYHDAHVRNLRVHRAQCDEIWAFVYAKQKNVTTEQMAQGAGDVWTWTAIDADTKLIISYMLGDRGAGTAQAFMQDVAARITNRVQLTSDGYHVYADAVEDAFGADIDYAMLQKIYGAPSMLKCAATAPQPVSAARLRSSLAALTRTTFPRHSSSARIFRCGWGCAVLPGSQTVSARS